jgi:hypothetical protein
MRRQHDEQALGQVGERVERVVELVGGRRVGEAEAEVVRGDHAVAVGEQRDQVAEHVRAGRKPVQQKENGRVSRSGLAVEERATLDGGVAVVDGAHVPNSFKLLYWLDTQARHALTCQAEFGG